MSTRLKNVEEKIARIICRMAGHDADDICRFCGEFYGKPHWVRYVGTARLILQIIIAEAKNG